MTGVGVGDEAQRLVAQCELGVAEEGVVGRGDEATGHIQDGVGGLCPDACGEFPGLRFPFGGSRLAEWVAVVADGRTDQHPHNEPDSRTLPG